MRRAYTIDSERSRVIATARSSVHDTHATFADLSGTILADPDALAETGAVALTITVAMASGEAGDFLRTRKLRGDIDAERYPEAAFTLERVVDVSRAGSDFEATGEGILRWRDRELTLQPRGRGSIDEAGIEARASFSFDMRDFGVTPPKFLMLKVEPEVEVEVELVARADAGE